MEFNRIWKNAKEFGVHNDSPLVEVAYDDQGDIDVFFNSPRTLDKNSSEESNLTNQVVRLIDGAQNNLKIATTRVRLQPILEALQAAAAARCKFNC